MNIIYPTSPKPNFYDRSLATANAAYFNVGLAPHSGTSRISFSVPAGKVYVIDLIMFRTRRQTVATTVGYVTVDANFTRNSVQAGLLQQSWSNNTQFFQVVDIHPCQIWLKAGDSLGVSTLDASTGGTVQYDLTIGYYSFDA